MQYQAPWQKRLDNLTENHGHCQFLGALLAPLIATGLTDVGLGALAGTSILGATVPEIAGGVLGGAGIGAATSGLTGGNPLLGALGGGLSGAIGSFGPALGAATGIGTVGGDILTGVAGGVLSSEITGGSPLTGALTGGATGAISGVLAPGSAASTAGGTAGATPGQGGSAAATAVPAGGGPAVGGGTTSAAFGDAFNTPAFGGTAGTAAAGMGGNIGIGGAQSTIGTIGGGPGGTSVSGTPGATATGSGAVSGTPTASSGGGDFGAPWATPANVQAGWNAVAAGGGSPVAADTGGIGGIVKGIEGDISKLFSSPTALVAGGLLASQMFGSSSSAEDATMAQLQAQAESAASTATQLQAPLRSGVLPPGAQASLDLAKANAEASSRSAYAAMGMGDSTGQADAFQAIAENIAAQKVGIEDLLFSQAGPYAELASTDYNNILNQQRAQDQQFTGALTNFVAALAGSTAGSRTAA
jgi:hypothetical protein